MSHPLIKICGVKNPEIARQAAQLGAHFIGLVFHPSSPRYVQIEQAKMISQATKAEKAIPVGIFVNHTAQEIADIAAATHIECIQLHGPKARQQHHLLPPKYPRIYVQTVAENGVIDNDDDGGLLYCDSSRDFILFDSIHAGTGQTFPWNSFYYNGPLRLGIAGGLNADNVRTAIEKFQPTLVDVSSGVEKTPGEKDLALIQQFIHRVNTGRSKYSLNSSRSPQ